MARFMLFIAATTMCACQLFAQSTNRVSEIVDRAAKQVFENSTPCDAEVDEVLAKAKEELLEALKRFSDAGKLDESIATKDAIQNCRLLVATAAKSPAPNASVNLPGTPPSVLQILNKATAAVRKVQKQLGEKNRSVIADAEKALKAEKDSLTKQQQFPEALATQELIFKLKDEVEARSAAMRSPQPPVPADDEYATAIGNPGTFIVLKVGGITFSNRKYTWTVVPEELNEWLYEPVQSRVKQAEKTVVVKKSGFVYVACVPGGPEIFAQKGWQPVPAALADSFGNKFNLYKKEVQPFEVVPIGHPHTGTHLFFKRVVNP